MEDDIVSLYDNIVTLKELILCLPDESQKKVLELVQEAHDSIDDNITIPINMQYRVIEAEIKKYMREE